MTIRKRDLMKRESVLPVAPPVLLEDLRHTRDLLLPKLISGEVDVSELDIAVPEEIV